MSSHFSPPHPTSTHVIPPQPTLSNLNPRHPTSTHFTPPQPTSSHLNPPQPTSSHLNPHHPTSTHILTSTHHSTPTRLPRTVCHPCLCTRSKTRAEPNLQLYSRCVLAYSMCMPVVLDPSHRVNSRPSCPFSRDSACLLVATWPVC